MSVLYPGKDWKYGTVLRRKQEPSIIVMVIARRDSTKMQMTLLADPGNHMQPAHFYKPGTVFNWTAGFGGWEVVDDT